MAGPIRVVRAVIIGRGLLAERFSPCFSDDESVVIFASGVSNSTEQRQEAFDRERKMLIDALELTRERLVYFSSCGVANRTAVATPYMRHKAAMEALVFESDCGLVLRLPQVVGKTLNANTLTNYLYSRLSRGERFHVWGKAERNLIDVDDVYEIARVHIVSAPVGSAIAIASNETLCMPEIVAIFERVTGLAATFDIVDAGERLDIDNRRSSEIAGALGIHIGMGYTESVIGKYYAPHIRD